MGKQIGCSVIVVGLLLWCLPLSANKNFVADWTFQGSSLHQFRTLGEAEWHVENGEIVGVPRSSSGGWLILDKPLQDVQFAAQYRCTGGCRAGVMLRTQVTIDGIRGAYVELPNGSNPAGSFALKLDSQGHEVSRQSLKSAGGMVRFMVPPSPPPGAGTGSARRPGLPGRNLPPGSPYTRPDYAYQPDKWNPLEAVLDANILRVWIHDGPESGATNGQVDDDVAKFGPVALYVGGTGEVRFKSLEFKDLGRRILPNEEISTKFRMQRISDFYYGWSATAADINHDGILDIVSGPFYYLGPDFQVSHEIYLSKTF